MSTIYVRRPELDDLSCSLCIVFGRTTPRGKASAYCNACQRIRKLMRLISTDNPVATGGRWDPNKIPVGTRNDLLCFRCNDVQRASGAYCRSCLRMMEVIRLISTRPPGRGRQEGEPCKKGHPWTEETIRIRRSKNRPDGVLCTICLSETTRARKERIGKREPTVKTQQCRKCDRVLPARDFSLCPTNTSGLQYACQRCCSRRARERKYNLPDGGYDIMFEGQNRGCFICGGLNSDGRDLAVDHDHRCCPGDRSCGKCVRALLCEIHNAGLGAFQDSPLLLRASADYIENPPPLPWATEAFEAVAA